MSHRGHGYDEFEYMTFMLDVLMTLVNLGCAVGVIVLIKEVFFSKEV